MNSKELLEHAEQRIAEVEKIKSIKKSVEELENLLKDLTDEMAWYSISFMSLQDTVLDDYPLDQRLSAEQYRRLYNSVRSTLNQFLSENVIKLEKLLGIRKPATANLVFEKAVQEMEQSVNIVDVVEEKLKVVLQDEAKKIESPDKSQDKYPAPKQNKRVKTPENMVEADVRKMYVEENRDRKYIADHYGISESKVNNYLFLHDIKRKATKASKPAEPEETERPLHS
jgi:hypothetical protein